MPYKDKAAKRDFARQWMQTRRRAWIDEHGPCAECGDKKDLELYYIGRGKPNHRVWSYSKERRELLLAEYQVLCHRCRIDRTCVNIEKRAEILHLLMAGYGTRSTAALTGVTRDTISRYSKSLDGVSITCGCGKDAKHTGPCWWRLPMNQLSLPTVNDLRYMRMARSTIRQIRERLRSINSEGRR